MKAVQNSFLRSCIAAVASKQLGRLIANTSYLEQQHPKPTILRIHPIVSQAEWFYKAANYYDRAISSLRIYLHYLDNVSGLAPANDPARAADSRTDNASTQGPHEGEASPQQMRLRISDRDFREPKRDDLLVAVSILSEYESLDCDEKELLQYDRCSRK